MIRAFQGTDYLQMWADSAEAEEARREQQPPTKPRRKKSKAAKSNTRS